MLLGNKAEHCVNCSGDHAASSKTCPKWQLEQKVQQVKAEKNILFIEARKMVTAQLKPQQPSMASVVSSAAPRSVPPVSTKDVEVQTDYTWPETAQQPTKIVKSKSVTSKSTATDAGKSVIAGESAITRSRAMLLLFSAVLCIMKSDGCWAQQTCEHMSPPTIPQCQATKMMCVFC